jgi:hypothetical protein
VRNGECVSESGEALGFVAMDQGCRCYGVGALEMARMGKLDWQGSTGAPGVWWCSGISDVVCCNGLGLGTGGLGRSPGSSWCGVACSDCLRPGCIECGQ